MTLVQVVSCDQCQRRIDAADGHLPLGWYSLVYAVAMGNGQQTHFCSVSCLDDYGADRYSEQVQAADQAQQNEIAQLHQEWDELQGRFVSLRQAIINHGEADPVTGRAEPEPGPEPGQVPEKAPPSITVLYPGPPPEEATDA